MTYEQREAIFSKEVMTIRDVQELMGQSYQQAAALIRQIKRKNDRLGVQGMLHVQDYLDYFGLDGGKRYEKRDPDEVPPPRVKSSSRVFEDRSLW